MTIHHHHFHNEINYRIRVNRMNKSEMIKEVIKYRKKNQRQTDINRKKLSNRTTLINLSSNIQKKQSV